MKYAILNETRDAVVDVREWDVLPAHKPGRVLPLVIADAPAYDPATHKIVEGALMIEDGQVVQTWETVELNGFEKYQIAVAAGYVVEPEGLTLRLEENDRVQFAQMLALVKEALDLGAITNDTPQTIADITGAIHTVTTLRFRQIMLQYGLHYKGLWDQLASSGS